jgi:hypothetical protein
MKKILIAVALTAAMQVSVAKASTFNIFFSFTSTSNIAPNVAGTVTGEIFGLTDNVSNAMATDVRIFSPIPSGLGLSLTLPFDIPSSDITVNTFQTSGGHIISADFEALGSSVYKFFLTTPTGLLQNPVAPIRTTSGPLVFSPVPLPAALPLFATGLGGLGLLGWRRKRKAQAVG